MASNRAVFVHSAALEQYHYPPDCPFKTERAGLTRRILSRMGLLTGDGRSEQAFPAASRDTLETFHTARYLDTLIRAAEGHLDVEGYGMGIGQPDCPAFSGLYDYAALATGGTVGAADLLDRGEARVAFNPSGGYHHAGPETASGFCYLNDVVVACLVLAERKRRVLFLDIDVHHGDGVQNAFYDRSDVMTISLHESGETLFPGTGAVDEIGTGPGEGYCVNVPLPVGTYDEAYLRAFDAIAVPLIGAYDPDLIVFEVGMDALAGDPLAYLSLTNNTHAAVAKRILEFGKPILAVGGGGYHPANTARGWALVWCVLCGEEDPGDLAMGLGGVMLESTDWQGGLRDRRLVAGSMQTRAVDPVVDATIEAIQTRVFPFHRL